MALDDDAANGIIAQLTECDLETCATIMVRVLQSRPEIALTVVDAAVPELTFPPSKILTHNRGHGVVKSFSQEKGFGFIECPELKEAYGQDVFLHGKQVKDFQVGDAVTFAIVLNKDGNPQAFDVYADGKGGKGAGASSFGSPAKGGTKGWGDAGAKGWGDDGGKGWGKDWGWGDAGGAKGWGKGEAYGGAGMGMAKGTGKQAINAGSFGAAKGAGAAKAGGKETVGQFVGTIKSFSDKTGFGFIDCAETRQVSGGDVFLHHAQLGHYGVGDQVMFTAFTNEKGQFQAKDLCPPGRPGGKGASPGKGPDVQEVLGSLTGVIKSFSEKNGFGFIACEELQQAGHKDAFLHHAQLGDLPVGTVVQFTAFINSKGNVQAKDVVAADGSPAKRARLA